MAHLLEHMLFKGTPTMPNVFSRARPARHARSTARPGTTAPTTSRRSPRPTTNLEWALKLEADRMVNRRSCKQGPRHRDDGRAQRVRERREQPAAASCASGWRPARTTGTTTASRRSARAPTSRTCRSTRLQAFYAKYYQPDNAVLIDRRQVRRPRARADREVRSARSRSRRARCRRLHRSSRRRTASARSPCAASATRSGVGALYHTCRGRASGRDRGRGARASPDRRARRAGCTRRWSRRKKASRVETAYFRLHDPGFVIFSRRCRTASRSTRRATRCSPRSTDVAAQPITDAEVDACAPRR